MSADDNRLISESLNGDPEAFGQLVRRYQDRLFNSVCRQLDNPEDAHDVVQEAFLNAYQSLDTFKGHAEFFTWLYRIAFNTAISLKRKHKVTLSIDMWRHGDTSLEPLDGSEAARPGHDIEKAEDEQQVQGALNRLSPEHRLVLILKDMEGEKYETIAEIMDVPIGTVRSRLHRARAELRELLERDD